MNLKKLSKITDSSKQDKIRELITNAGFTYNAETETVTSDIEDYEEADDQAWELYGSIEELLEGDEVDALGEPDGGEFFLDKQFMEGESMSVLNDIEDSKIQDSDWESQLWKAINAGKRDFTITIDPNEMESDQLEDYISESFEDTGDCASVSVSIEGNQASIRIEECDDDYEDI